jgi:hypothetical protein
MKRKINRNRDDIAAARSFDNEIFNEYNNITNTNILNYSSIIYNIIDTESTFGFILLRYVNSHETNKAWIECYNSIRQFYNNKIIIIDDNSNKDFLTDHSLINTIVINSEFHKRGEFLPYYYYIKNNYFSRAVVIHDSMKIKKYYDFMNIPNYKNYTRLFSFPNNSYIQDIEYFKDMTKLIKHGDKLYSFHTKNIKSMIGCFGVCYVIDYEFINDVEKKYNITNLINFIDTRKKRMTLERFLSCLFEFIRGKSFITPVHLFGSIFTNKNEYVEKTFYGR